MGAARLGLPARTSNILFRNCPYTIVAVCPLCSARQNGACTANERARSILTKAEEHQSKIRATETPGSWPKRKTTPSYLRSWSVKSGRDGKGDVVLGKALSELPKTELFEPISNLLHRQLLRI